MQTQVNTPSGVVTVDHPDTATRNQILAFAKKKHESNGGKTIGGLSSGEAVSRIEEITNRNDPSLPTEINKVGENLLNIPDAKRAANVASEGVAESFGGLLGLPVDAVNSLLGLVDQGLQAGGDEPLGLRSNAPVMGSHRLTEGAREILRKFGLEPDDAQLGNLVENLLQIGGSAALPGGTLIKGANTAKALGTNNPVLKNIANHNKEFVAGEAIASGGGAVGRTAAEQTFPESDAAGMIGELVGMPTALLLDAGVRVGKEAVVFGKNNLTEEGSLNKASAEVQKNMTGSKEEALSGLETASNTPISGAKLTDDLGLIERQRELDAFNAEFALENQKAVIENLTEKLQSVQGNVSGDDFVAQARAEIELSLHEIERGVNEAARRAEDELANLNGATRQDASRIARANLEDAYNKLDLRERELWDTLELDVPIKLKGISNTSSALKEIISDGSTGRKIPSDMVSLVEKFIFDKDFVNKTTSFKDNVSVKTLQNLRSRILAEMRESSSGANPDANRAAQLSKLQEALLNDMLEVPQTSPDLTVAIAHSKKMNDTFNRGRIGKLRGTSSDGSLRTDPDLTLSKMVRKGEEGGVNLRDFLSADSSNETRRVVGEYVQQLFLSDVAPGGVVNTGKARAFLNNYKFALEHLPEVRTRLNRAIDSGDAFEAIGESALLSKKAIQQSALKTFLDIEDPGRAIRTIRQSKTPTRHLESLAESARKDQTGNALEGLRTIVAEDILSFIQKSESVPGAKNDLKKLSPANADKALTGVYRNALEEANIFDSDQLTLLDSIAEDIQINERTVSAKLPGTSGTSQDLLGTSNDFIAKGLKLTALRFVSPLVGKGAGSLSAAGTVGSLAEKLGRKIGTEKTNDLVRKALTGGTKEDRELLKTLIQRIPDAQAEVEAVKKLRGHLLTIDERDKKRKTNNNVNLIGEITNRANL